MKRIAWLLMLVVGTALAQVRPVTLPDASDDACGCCGAECACALPAECAPPPMQAGATPVKVSPATTLRAEQRQFAQAPAGKVFYADFVPAASIAAGLPAPAKPVLTASAPLFTAHCSLRI
ncbi:MAG: hypothetical protein RLZZ129_340 [Verrucomicrobiota bacterium]|jgi:hypothetical protein